MELVTAEQMRTLEQAAVANGVSLDALMENAGLAVAEAVRAGLESLQGPRVLVLVGPGNNGGDGLVAARHLSSWGVKVTAYIVSARPDPDAKMATAVDAGVAVVEAASDEDLSRLRELSRDAHVVLDAILGTGRARPIAALLAEQLDTVRKAVGTGEGQVVAIDLPTGIDCDTGEADPHTLPADRVLMLGRPKAGPFLRPMVEPLHAIETLDIGLPDGVQSGSTAELVSRELAASLLPHRPIASNKGTFGRAFLVAGSSNFVGAAYLAAAAAGRVGTGLVTLATPSAVYSLVAGRLADATYVPLPESEPGELDAGWASSETLPVLGQATAALIGPGLGQAPTVRAFLHRLLLEGEPLPPSVLDADCLNYLATVDRWWRQVGAPAVLTPHPGEMARLTNTSVADVQADRLGGAIDAAERWGKVVVLKGACTVIAHPEGRARISPFANSGLATAGTGDVLAGAIVGLMAQRLDPFDAATLGVYLQGLAGEMARDALGAAGMVASDVLERLPAATMALDAATS